MDRSTEFFCFVFLPVADVSPLPGAVSLHHAGRVGGSRAESSHLPLLHAGLRPHGTVHVRGSRLQPRAVSAAAELLSAQGEETLGQMLILLWAAQSSAAGGQRTWLLKLYLKILTLCHFRNLTSNYCP